jgi:hypothetical protein
MYNSQRFVIEPKASRFTVQAFAGGLRAGSGHNPTIAIRDFSGEMHVFAEIAGSGETQNEE